MTIAEAAKALQQGRALPVALFKELLRDCLLLVHVEACRNWRYADSHGASQQQCGDDWYCEKAKRIEELGK